MGNPKSPFLQQGIAAYQKVLKQKDAPAEQEGAPVVGGLLKTPGRPRPAPVPPSKPAGRSTPSVLPSPKKTGGEKESKARRVAKLLILIGGDEAAKILAELDKDQVEAVSREIAAIRGIRAEEGEEILAEFRSLLSAPYGCSGASSGGLETARRILYAAFGPEKGEALLNKTVPGSKENIFGFLEDFSPEQAALLLRDESPASAALVLSRLPAKLSAAVLAKAGPNRLEIARRIARQGNVSPEVLERAASALKEKARHLGGADAGTLEIDGLKTLTAILKQGDYSFGDRLISELEERSPELGRGLKEQLYTLDDAVLAHNRPLQEKLRTMSDRDIALLVKGRGDEFSGKILANVSAQRRALIREEGEMLGAVPKRDCDAAARDFLAWFRRAREEGEIILASDEDVFV